MAGAESVITQLSLLLYMFDNFIKTVFNKHRWVGCPPERWAPALPGPSSTLAGVLGAHTRLPGGPHPQPRIGGRTGLPGRRGT